MIVAEEGRRMTAVKGKTIPDGCDVEHESKEDDHQHADEYARSEEHADEHSTSFGKDDEDECTDDEHEEECAQTGELDDEH